MRSFWSVFKLSLLDVLQYRFEFLMQIFKYTFATIMMALVWLAVQKETQVAGITPQSTVRYFFFAAILYSLSNFHVWYIEANIRLGELSKFLLKPFSAFQYYFAYQSAIAFFDLIIKAVVMIPLLHLLHFSTSVSAPALLLFLLYIPVIFFFSFSVHFAVSCLSFWLQEVYSIRWSVLSAMRFLGGIIVPLQLLPTIFTTKTFWLPFQHLAYTPIQVIEGTVSVERGLAGLGVLIIWSIVAILIKSYVWSKGTHSYEATGI